MRSPTVNVLGLAPNDLEMTMQQPSAAHVDPEQLREFAMTLAALARRLSDIDQSMAMELARLGETFCDAEYDKFRTHFMGSRQKLVKFTEDIRAVVPKLRADADDVARSQGVRIR